MSLSELARADARAILSADGETVTLTAPPALDSAVYVVPCIFNRAGVSRDLEGIPAPMEYAEITVSVGELGAKGLADPESLKLPGWAASVGGGAYTLDTIFVDYVIGEVLINLKKAP